MKAFVAKHPILSLVIGGALLWLVIAEWQSYQKYAKSKNGMLADDFGVDPNTTVPPPFAP